MEVVVVVLLVLNIALIAYMLLKPKQSTSNSDVLQFLKQDLNGLNLEISKLRESTQKQLETSLDKSQASMSKQLAASAQIVKEVTERLAQLENTNKQVVNIADELKSLQSVLQNPKQRGVLGEFYL